MFGGPLGAVFGAAFGHNFDRGLNNLGGAGFAQNVERLQTAFLPVPFLLWVISPRLTVR